MFGLWLGGWLCDRWAARDERFIVVPALSLLGSLPFMLLFLLWPEDHRIDLGGGWPLFPVVFAWSVASSILGAMHSAPFLARAGPRPGAHARLGGRDLSLTGTGVGSAIGPLLVGYLSESFEVVYGEDSLRWGSSGCPSGSSRRRRRVLAARSVRGDLSRARAERDAESVGTRSDERLRTGSVRSRGPSRLTYLSAPII